MELALENYHKALPHLNGNLKARVQTKIIMGESKLVEDPSSAD
jgi:hypothetical protein